MKVASPHGPDDATVHRGNLARPPTQFVGRSKDLAALQRLLRGGAHLVTLWGPAGMGKTRLALEYALREQETAEAGHGGAWFCDLSESRDRVAACLAIARCFDAPVTLDRKKTALVDKVGDILSVRSRALLVLDNLEQVIDDLAPTLARWLARAPDLQILATSRERLRIAPEVAYELLPLDLPSRESQDVNLLCDAERLFVDRVHDHQPDLPVTPATRAQIADIVKTLDGIPLAIELAAARHAVLGLSRLRERLDRQLDVLASTRRGVPGRQLTLRNALEWSWELLDASERQALACCAVFHGAFSLDAAASVLEDTLSGALDRLQSLYEKSLLRVATIGTDPVRFSFYAGIREFAAEKLSESGDIAKARSRHASYFVQKGEELAATFEVTGSLRSLEEISGKLEDLFAIARTGVEPSGGEAGEALEPALRALLAIEPVLTTRGPFGAQIELLDRLIPLAERVPLSPALLARAHQARGRARQIRGLVTEAQEDLEHARDVAAKTPQQQLVASVLVDLGVLHHHRKDTANARRYYEEALEIHRRTGDHRSEGRALGNLGAVLHDEHDFVGAARMYERALAIFAEVGDLRLAGTFRANLAILMQERGRTQEARRHYESALATLEEVGDKRLIAMTLTNCGNLDHEEGRLDDAMIAHDQARTLLRESGDVRSEALCLARWGAVAATAGRIEEASHALERAEVIIERVRDTLALETVQANRCLVDLGRYQRLLADKRPKEAATVLKAILERVRRARSPQKQGGPPLVERSDDIRVILRIVDRNLTALGQGEPRDSKRSLLVGPNCRSFRPPVGTWIDLRHRPILRGMLAALVEQHLSQPGRGVSLEGLKEAGWPGENIRTEAAVNRIHVTLNKLRQAGLRDLLLHTREGYRFDPELEVRHIAFDPIEGQTKDS